MVGNNFFWHVVAEAAATLEAAGVPTPRVDAELLAAYTLKVPRSRLLIAHMPTDSEIEQYRQLVAIRATRVPVQHVTGEAPFRRRVISVGPGVFIPRPETELLVEWGLAELDNRRSSIRQNSDNSHDCVIVDLCSGSGAIAVAIADEYPSARVYAVDKDPQAVMWLHRNVDAAGGRERKPGCQITIVEADARDPDTLVELNGLVDLVLCNPPYVPLGTVVAPEVAHFDPEIAVFAGKDGLEVIRGIIVRVADLLRAGGCMGMEHDESHHHQVVSCLAEDGRYEAVVSHRDLAGRPRFVTAIRKDDTATGGDQ